MAATPGTDLDHEQGQDLRNVNVDAAGSFHGLDMVGKRNPGLFPSSERRGLSMPGLTQETKKGTQLGLLQLLAMGKGEREGEKNYENTLAF